MAAHKNRQENTWAREGVMVARKFAGPLAAALMSAAALASVAAARAEDLLKVAVAQRGQ